MKYEPLATYECDLSETPLEEAAAKIGPSFVYELRVNMLEEARARRLLRMMGADVQHHPFAPYINLIIERSYAQDEWSISANGKCVGSKGA